MDQTAYKDVTTTRGFKYHYYVSIARDSKPTILFVHGFPSTSQDWRHQVAFFKNEGYGLVVPDMLGYGGTDKPTDPKHYKMSSIATDLVDILDAEKVPNAIVVGHDWGSVVASRLANYYSDRFTAFAFLAAAYRAPSPGVDVHALNEYVKNLVGYELFGYWFFFSSEGADKILEEKWDSFRSLLYPADPAVWKTDFAPSGSAAAWLAADKRTPLPSYLTEDECNQLRDSLLKGGFAGPLCWYKTMVLDINSEDDKAVPLDKYDIEQPVFYGGAVKDCICLSALGKGAIAQRCKNPKTVIKEYDGDHWIILSHAKALNDDLLAWIQSI